MGGWRAAPPADALHGAIGGAGPTSCGHAQRRRPVNLAFIGMRAACALRLLLRFDMVGAARGTATAKTGRDSRDELHGYTPAT